MKFVAMNFKREQGAMRFIVTKLKYLLTFTKQHSKPTIESDLGTRIDHIVQLKHCCEDFFYFPTDLSGAPKSREPLNLPHSSRFSAHHGVECNPTRT